MAKKKAKDTTKEEVELINTTESTKDVKEMTDSKVESAKEEAAPSEFIIYNKTKRKVSASLPLSVTLFTGLRNFVRVMPGQITEVFFNEEVVVPQGFDLVAVNLPEMLSKKVVVHQTVNFANEGVRSVFIQNTGTSNVMLNEGDPVCALKLAYAPNPIFDVITSK